MKKLFLSLFCLLFLISIGQAEPRTVKAVVFYSPYCFDCEELRTNFFPQIEKEFKGKIEIKYFNILEARSNAVYVELQQKANLPPRFLVPAVFINNKAILKDAEIIANLKSLIKTELQSKNYSWPYKIVFAEKKQKAVINQQIKAINTSLIFFSGLTDGINPCSFSTIIFLVAFLSFIGRSKRDIAWIGIFYVLAEFLTYFLLGWGLLAFLKRIIIFNWLYLVLYSVVTLLVLLAVIISGLDFLKARQGKFSEITLQLPAGWKRLVHSLIRENMRTSFLAGAAFLIGVLIALVESVCTGQVYLPVLFLMIQSKVAVGKAFSWLVLYNFLFVLPTIIIFLLAYRGISSERLQKYFHQETPAAKLILGVIFLFIFIMLLFFFPKIG